MEAPSFLPHNSYRLFSFLSYSHGMTIGPSSISSEFKVREGERHKGQMEKRPNKELYSKY